MCVPKLTSFLSRCVFGALFLFLANSLCVFLACSLCYWRALCFLGELCVCSFCAASLCHWCALCVGVLGEVFSVCVLVVLSLFFVLLAPRLCVLDELFVSLLGELFVCVLGVFIVLLAPRLFVFSLGVLVVCVSFGVLFVFLAHFLCWF